MWMSIPPFTNQRGFQDYKPMAQQEVSINPACKLVTNLKTKLFFLNALVEERIAPRPDQEGAYRTPTRLKIHY
jgi:hypothetical protein